MKIILAALLLQIAGAQQLQFAAIEGRVTQTNGEVVSKVTVTLMEPSASTPQPSAPMPTTVTDADGKFVFASVKPGSYRLRASRMGFVDGEYGQKGPNGIGVSISLSSGEKLKDLNVRITPLGAIAGRIFDRNGMPEIRALIRAWKPVYKGPQQGRVLTDVQTTITDDQGNYRLFWLVPGEYLVTAVPDGAYGVLLEATASQTRVSASFSFLTSSVRINGQEQNGSARSEVAATSTYYPGAAHLMDATPVVVRAGTTSVGIDFGIATVPVHRLRGVTINGNTGSPQSMRVQLTYESQPGTRSISHISSETGAFEFGGLLPGSYSLMALSEGLVFVAPVQIGNEDVNNFVVKTQLRDFPIRARVSLDRTTANSSDPGPSIYVRLVPTLVAGILPPPLAVEIRDQEFTIRTVFPGDYRVKLEGNSNLYLKSVRLGNQDGLDVLHIQIPPDSPLELELSSRRGTIDGRIVNERREPATNATVVLVPDPPNRQRAEMYLTPAVDASGRFHVDAIPGFYKVFALEDVETGIWLEPGFMSTNENRGRPLVVSEGRNEGIEVLVIPYVP